MRRALLMLFIAMLALTLTGCWDRNELNTLFIVTGIGIDRAADSDQLNVTVQVRQTHGENSSMKGDSGPSSFLLLNQRSASVLDAIETLDVNRTRRLFLQHNQVLIFDASLAEDGVLPYMDLFTRDAQTRMEAWVLLSDDPAREILATELDVDSVSGIALSTMIKSQTRATSAFGVRVLDLISSLTLPSSAIAIPIVAKDSTEDMGKLTFRGMALFNGDKMVGRIEGDALRGYLWSAGDVNEDWITFEIPGGSAALKVVAGQRGAALSRSGDGRFTYSITIDLDAIVGEIQGGSDIEIDAFESILAKGACDALERDIERFIDKSKALKCDVLKIGDAIRKRYPDAWQAISEDWLTLYPEVDFDIQIRAQILEDGRISIPLGAEEAYNHNEQNR